MSKYKVGDKVVLTVTGMEEAVCHPYYVLNDNNFNILVSSIDKCAEPLSTYTEPLEAKIRRQAAEITRLLAENKELKNKEQELTRERNQLMGRCGGLSAARIKKFNDGRLAGQNEAWELARKIVLKNGYSAYDLHEIFNCCGSHQALEDYTYPEAAAKVAEWEKAKEEIKRGDIIRNKYSTSSKFCVTDIGCDGHLYGVGRYGLTYSNKNPEDWEKTGRHIDIDGFLKQIGEEKE